MRKLTMALLLALAAAVVVGCGGASDETDGGDNAAASGGDGSKGSLSLVAYSTPQVVYDEIIPAFGQTPEGEGIEFKTSFGASGDQSRAVEAGQKADVVTFSTEPDMTRLVDAGLVDSTWKDGDNEGLVTTSLVSFVVRKGNPKNIQSWDDLLKPGIEVLTPNPFSSGAAKWNLLAAYGYASDGGKNPDAGLDYVNKLLTEHVKVQDKSGREALQNFLGGNGDVLLSYEYEAITANKNGEKLEYVTPDDTIKINIDIATTKDAPESATAVPRLRPRRGRAAEVRRLGLPPGQRDRPRGEQGQVPGSGRPLHHRGPRRLGEGERRPVRHRGRRHREDRGGSGGVHGGMTTASLTLRRPATRPGVLGLGISTLWLSLIVLLPLAAVVVRSTEGGFDTFWNAVSSRQAMSALEFTIGVSLISTVINAVVGTLIAWVLVRDQFRGKRFVNALIDLPFALPTIVAGLTLLALYGPNSPVGINVAFTQTAVLLALLFVTLPFVIRSVQPVLIELDKEMEEAAMSLGAGSFSIFRRVILPNLVPAILSGSALAFARAVGEFGSIVLISGNIPFETQVASMFIFKQIESDNPIGAAAISVVLLLISLVILIGIRGLGRWGARHDR